MATLLFLVRLVLTGAEERHLNRETLWPAPVPYTAAFENERNAFR